MYAEEKINRSQKFARDPFLSNMFLKNWCRRLKQDFKFYTDNTQRAMC